MARENTIQLFKTYIDQLDDVYKLESISVILESNAELIRQGKNAGTFDVPKIDMDGLAD